MRYRVWHQKKWHNIIIVGNGVYNNNIVSRTYEQLHNISETPYWIVVAWVVMLGAIFLSTR